MCFYTYLVYHMKHQIVERAEAALFSELCFNDLAIARLNRAQSSRKQRRTGKGSWDFFQKKPVDNYVLVRCFGFPEDSVAPFHPRHIQQWGP